MERTVNQICQLPCRFIWTDTSPGYKYTRLTYKELSTSRSVLEGKKILFRGGRGERPNKKEVACRKKRLKNFGNLVNLHCVKSIQIRCFFWSEYKKIRTRKNYVLRLFSRSVGCHSNLLLITTLWWLLTLHFDYMTDKSTKQCKLKVFLSEQIIMGSNILHLLKG